jgi:hypothetical protein
VGSGYRCGANLESGYRRAAAGTERIRRHAGRRGRTNGAAWALVKGNGCGPYLLGGKPPTPSSISNMGLIDGVPLPTLRLYNICVPLGLLHHNGSNPSGSTSGSNPVGSRAYFQQSPTRTRVNYASIFILIRLPTP